MMYFSSTVTPDGDCSVIVCAGQVLACGWTTDPGDLLSRVHPSLIEADLSYGESQTRFAIEAVQAYYSGQVHAIDTVPVRQQGAPFRMGVWQKLREIAPGQPITYSELAKRAGNMAAIRAAASACASNAVALFVPCHRVVAKSGGLAGFLYGVEVKRRLLAHESQVAILD